MSVRESEFERELVIEFKRMSERESECGERVSLRESSFERYRVSERECVRGKERERE